jgi:hypothetical protein
MKKELELKLLEKYPKLFQDYGGDPRRTCMAWGMSHGNGWYQILDELCEKIKDTGTVFNQIKEKFGMLTIYFSAPEKVYDFVSDAIKEAESKSLKICEHCGSKGKRVDDGGWLRTICKYCQASNEVEKSM